MRHLLFSKSRLQALCLLSLTLHTSGTAMIMHQSRNLPDQEAYSLASSVFLGEACKFMISLLLFQYTEDSPSTFLSSQGYSSIFVTLKQYTSSFRRILLQKDAYMLSIPAAFYVCQNMLQLAAVTNLSPMAYQALSQLKILAIASLSVLVLRRKISGRQWLCIALLLLGVLLVEIGERHDSKHEVRRPVNITMHLTHAFGLPWPTIHLQDDRSPLSLLKTNQVLSVLAILASCFFGSVGGILLEKRFKSDKISVWASNAQLSFFSMGPAGILVLQDSIKNGKCMLFHNFGSWAIATVLVRALGGILVAMVLKYCDNILKAFSTSAAMILTITVETLLSGKLPDSTFLLGAAFVIMSAGSYSSGYVHNVERQTKRQHTEFHLDKEQKDFDLYSSK